MFICCIKANWSVPDSSNRTYLDILKLDEGSIFHLRREALAFAEILERWRLPVIRKLFLKGFARKMIIQNEESNSQKKKTKQLDKFFGEKDILIISKMTIFFRGWVWRKARWMRMWAIYMSNSWNSKPKFA